MAEQAGSRYGPKIVVERTQTGVRMEKRMVKTLKGLAEYFEISLGDLLEGIVLHAFEGKSPFGPATLQRIEGLKQIYDMDYDARASHRFVEREPDDGPSRVSVVCLPAQDIPATARFYREAIGLRPASGLTEAPHFEVGSMLLVIQGGTAGSIETAEARPFPVVAFEVDNLDKAIERLEQHDVDLSDGITERNDCRWITLLDPAGTLIELIQYIT